MNWRIARVHGEEERLMQDENSGRDGRRYNEWHAGKPEARRLARNAAEAIAFKRRLQGRSGDGRTFIGSGEDADIYGALTGFNVR